MDSILLAHVADALESVTGERGYDAAADAAASLLERSTELRAVAARFTAGEASAAELHATVLGALHQMTGKRPFGDLDMGGEALLMDALGETGPTMVTNVAHRIMLLDAYANGGQL